MVLDLILAIQRLPSARLLISGLSNLILHVTSNAIDLKLTAPLLKSVVTRAEDQKIWNGIFDLIAQTRPAPRLTTPPLSLTSIASSIQQTPWSFNTSRFADTSGNRKFVDGALKQELHSNLQIDVPGFDLTFFGDMAKPNGLAKAVFDACQEGDAPLYTIKSGWAKWPAIAEETLALDCLKKYSNYFKEKASKLGYNLSPQRHFFGVPSKPICGSVAIRKMDVGIRITTEHDQEYNGHSMTSQTDWRDVLVVGELKRNPDEDKHTKTWFDLARYARQVFGAQDHRRFVLGFSLCGSVMRLWEFDRLGGIASSSFDINTDGLRFVQAMLGFFEMTPEQLGFDPTIQQSEGIRFIEIVRNCQKERLVLTKTIQQQSVIAGRATTCWEAYRDDDQSKEAVIIKDSWQYEERPEEGALLKQGTNDGVTNMARYYHHETVCIGGQVDDILENVRKGLTEKGGRDAFWQRQPPIKFEANTSSATPRSAAKKLFEQEQ